MRRYRVALCLLHLQSDDIQLTVQQQAMHFDRDISEFLSIWQATVRSIKDVDVLLQIAWMQVPWYTTLQQRAARCNTEQHVCNTLQHVCK